LPVFGHLAGIPLPAPPSQDISQDRQASSTVQVLFFYHSFTTLLPLYILYNTRHPLRQSTRYTLPVYTSLYQSIPVYTSLYQSIPVHTTLCHSRPLPTSLFIPVINIHHPTGQARGIPRSIPPSRSLATATGPGDTLAALGNTSSPLTTRTLPLFHWEYLQPTHSTPLKANPQLSPAHSAAQLHEVTPLPYLPYLPDTQNVQVQALQSKHMQ
jgi:hypothetical protein